MRELKYNGIKIEVIGRLTKDPELRATPSGKDVCTATVAAQGGWVSKEKVNQCPNGWKEDYRGKGYEYTLFIRMTAWDGHATRLSGMRKGDTLHVEAKLKGDLANGVCNPRTYTSRDGAARASWEMQISWFVNESDVPAGQEPPADLVDDDGEEIPW